MTNTTQIEVAGGGIDLGVEQAWAELVERTQGFADELAGRPDDGGVSAPVRELEALGALGLLTAPLPETHGGLGLGTEPGSHLPLLRVLAAVGGGDLALGRLYEGHVNALLLISAYGTHEQVAEAAEDARAGLIFGVWNTGAAELMRLEATGVEGRFRLKGEKTFASGAAFVSRPVVTAELPGVTSQGGASPVGTSQGVTSQGGGWQMLVLRMDAAEVAPWVKIDRSFWQPLGMESSESYRLDLTGAEVGRDSLLGKAGDFYRDPLFRGGAIRFAAVQAGAVLRLLQMFAAYLQDTGRGGDPYQIARLGEVAIGAQEAALWVERAAAVAESCFNVFADKLAIERMLECAGMTRLGIERIATAMMPRVIAGVGAHGLLRPGRFARVIRDLTIYLRQPAPDAALAEVGRTALRKSTLRDRGAGDGYWTEEGRQGSLPASYFARVYEKKSDPWGFETSEYEQAKYRDTLGMLTRQRYGSALEVGCSIGVLTTLLADRCERVVAVDVSEKALERARLRCGEISAVEFRRMEIPREMPEGMFELVVVSEVGYYWQREDLERAAALVAEQQKRGAHLLLVHYLPAVADYPMTGTEVHEMWCARPEWRVLRSEVREKYRMDLLERV